MLAFVSRGNFINLWVGNNQLIGFITDYWLPHQSLADLDMINWLIGTSTSAQHYNKSIKSESVQILY